MEKRWFLCLRKKETRFLFVTKLSSLALTAIIILNLLPGVHCFAKDYLNEDIPIISNRLQETIDKSDNQVFIPVVVFFLDNSHEIIQFRIKEKCGLSEFEWKETISKDSASSEIHEFKKIKSELSSEVYSENNRLYVEQCLGDSEVVFLSKYSPMVVANMRANEIKCLALSDVVLCIDLYLDEIVPCSIESQAAKIDLASNLFPCSGNGINIGIFDIEVPNYYDVPNCNLAGTYGSNTSGSTFSHAEYMTSIIANIAPDANYYCTGGPGLSYFDAIEWLIQSGADVINMSLDFGFNTSTYSIYSKWFDHIAYEHYVTFVTAIGNKGLDEFNQYTIVGQVSEFKMAYNLLSVGGINTNMTPYSYYDDYQAATIYSQSTSTNVPFKPDICAPYGDSSSSSALIAAVVSLLMEVDGGLIAFPDAVKAIITACVNQTSPFQFLPKNRVVNSSVNSYMQFGAGLIDAYLSLICADSSWYTTDSLTSSYGVKSYDFYAEYSGEQKISLSFLQPVDIITSNHSGNISYYNYSVVDLDIYIYDEFDNIVDYSTTVENNVEIVHFTIPDSGYYSVSVERYGTQSTGSIIWFTIAWCEVGT